MTFKVDIQVKIFGQNYTKLAIVPRWAFWLACFMICLESAEYDIVCLVAIDFGVLNYQVLPLGLSYNQFPNGTLLISSVDKSAQGSYTCTAQNGVRTAIAKTINVTVNGNYFSPLH